MPKEIIKVILLLKLGESVRPDEMQELTDWLCQLVGAYFKRESAHAGILEIAEYLKGDSRLPRDILLFIEKNFPVLN